MDLKPKNKEESIDFYVKSCRCLIWKMPTVAAKRLVAKWLRKLRFDVETNSSIRYSYVTALVFMVMKQHLFGPFSRPPPDLYLTPLGDRYSMNNLPLEYIKSKRARSDRTELSRVSVGRNRLVDLDYELSPDSREYAATQQIPDFGSHIYMATSIDPINTWLYVPSYLTEIDTMDYYHPCVRFMTHLNDVSCFVDPNTIYQRKKTKDKAPIKSTTKSSEIIKDFSLDLMKAPTWGSNLLPLVPEDLYAEEAKTDDRESVLLETFSKIESKMDVEPTLLEEFFKRHLSQIRKESKQRFDYAPRPSSTKTKFSLNDHISGRNTTDYSLYLKHVKRNDKYKYKYKNEDAKLTESTTFLHTSELNRNYGNDLNGVDGLIECDQLLSGDAATNDKPKTFNKTERFVSPKKKANVSKGAFEKPAQDTCAQQRPKTFRELFEKLPQEIFTLKTGRHTRRIDKHPTKPARMPPEKNRSSTSGFDKQSACNLLNNIREFKRKHTIF